MKDAVLIGLAVTLAVSLFLLSRQYRKTAELETAIITQESVIKSLKEQNKKLNGVAARWIAEQKDLHEKAERAKKKIAAVKKTPEVKAWADESIPQDVLDVLRD